MIIDANMYWLPEEMFSDAKYMQCFLRDLEKSQSTCGYHGYQIINDNNVNQVVIEKPEGKQNLNYVQYEYSVEAQLADMDKAGIDKAVLKLPGCQEWLSLEMCKRFNDDMAKHAKLSGGRLIPLAIVPPYGTPESLEEMDRCVNELGMKAFQVSAHYGDKYLDDEVFSIFFEKLNELNVSVYVHHTPLPVQYDKLLDYNNLRRSYGRCSDQTIAISRELFSGMFDKYPNVKLVHSMLGGGFFTYASLLMPSSPKGGQEKVERFKTDNLLIKEQFRNNIYFEMSHSQPWGKAVLECAISILGADHIIFGSSYPVKKEWLLEGADFIKTLNISEEEKEMILCKNAEKLYGI